ncbi:MAG TPA: hypothetical protein VGB15_08895 [Longimicrobium sp.]|jgi:hypothetical protein
MRLRRLLSAALPLALAAGACRDLPTAAPPAESPAPQGGRAQLRCSVGVRDQTMVCEPAGPRGIRRQIILGGQGLNVRLRTTNVSYDGIDDVLTADISVQNLLDQPIGTADGSSTYGVRVFFVSGPTVVEGSGTVQVLTDSMGTFTASNQRYFVYNEIIQPRGVSAPQTWSFSVPAEATRFEFMVLVETRTPAETSALHFRPERGSPVYYAPIYGVWAAAPHDVFAVTDGAVLHYDGNYWRAMDAGGCGCASSFFAVWGSDGRDVWAVGGFGSVGHWTGGAWEDVVVPGVDGEDLNAVWGSGAADVWAVGTGGVIAHYDGEEWSTQGVDGMTEALRGVWGSGPNDVWAVGDAGNVLHFDGVEWSVATTFPVLSLLSVWGTGPNDVWAAGIAEVDGGLGGTLYHWDGVSWTGVTGPEIELAPLWSGWSSGPADVWVATVAGDVLRWDGDAWTRMPVGAGAPLYGIAGTSGGNVFTVGDGGTIARSTGGAFATQSLSEDETVSALWGSSASDVWAVGGSRLLHRTGSGTWTSETTPGEVFVRALWGASASQVWAAGDGVVIHYDGVSWTPVHGDAALKLNGLWGASAGDVWAVGDGGALLHWNGTAWTGSTAGAFDLTAVWGSAGSDVFAVGRSGGIQHWNGSAWTPMNSGTTLDLWAVWGSGSGNVYAAGDDGTILHYNGNAGLNWTAVTTPADPAGAVNAIWGTGASDIYVLANDGLDLLHWNGSSWRTMSQFSANADVFMYALWGTGPNNLYAAGDAGTILHGLR